MQEESFAFLACVSSPGGHGSFGPSHEPLGELTPFTGSRGITTLGKVCLVGDQLTL